MKRLFWRQLFALSRKNAIVLSKYSLLNILRCFILPVAYGIFLAVAQVFLNKPSNFGIGAPIPVFDLVNKFDGSLSLVWADGTDGAGSPSPSAVMAHITRAFSPKQLRAVKQVASPEDIPSTCPQNFNLFSECFAAVAFNSVPASSNASLPVNYTIRADGGLWHIDVVRHSSDYENRILPLQWALDQAIIELRTGQQMPTPQEWPFTQETNKEQHTDIRLSYIRGLRTLLVLALFICYIGIAYQLPGAFMGEQANGLTPHMKAMGLLDSARILSWHASISLAYLPAWVIVALTWHYRIFTGTNAGLVLVIHLILGLSLASWSFFVGMPFNKSPQLAAVASTFLSIVFAILALVMGPVGSFTAFVYTIVFPPGFYIFSIRTIAGFENHLTRTNVLDADPDSGMRLLPIIIAGIIDIFLWPCLAILLERRLYDAREPYFRANWWSWRRQTDPADRPAVDFPSDVAISIKGLQKTFTPSLYQPSKAPVTAITDLSFDIPKFGIFVLLGSNGAGKSTVLSILGGLLGRTHGSVTFEGGVAHPSRGTLGIVPQKNVLFPELSCYQTLRLWQAVKHSDAALEGDEDIEQLLRDCDLGNKIHANAEHLSGGQKRKLQLAIGLVGGSKIVLVDECTSGVDPLSRRALWRTLSSVRHERTIIFTTHFLDEADLLADQIVILAAPGKLLAEGSPVTLKSTLGEGYIVDVSFKSSQEAEKAISTNPHTGLLERIRRLAPATYVTSSSPTHAAFHLKSKHTETVEAVLRLLDAETHTHGITSYDIQGTSVEDIFLALMNEESRHLGNSEDLAEKDSSTSSDDAPPLGLHLSNGRKMPPLAQALTIFQKRGFVARRSWLTLVLLVFIAVAGSCIPLFFMAGRTESCTTRFHNATTDPLYLPLSLLNFLDPAPSDDILTSPPNIIGTLGLSAASLTTRSIPDNATFISTIREDYRNISRGGISLDLQSGQSLVAWEASPPGLLGPTMLNLATNVLYNLALNRSGSAGSAGPSLILANYESFPAVDAGTLVALKWIAFLSAAMAVYPAFFSLYVSRERRSSVQAMQFSNGLSNPVGLWLGHLLFDSMFVVAASTIIIIVFASASNQFHGLGFFWIVFVLYGIVGALFSYCISLATASPLAAFATAAGYQIINFVIYLAAYLLTLTYAKTSQAGRIITILHFTLSILSPVASIMRAGFVSVNLFSLTCRNSAIVTSASLASITRYGGPIVYLFVYGFILFGILVWVDSGSILPRNVMSTLKKRPRHRSASVSTTDDDHDVDKKADIKGEVDAVAESLDSLRVLHVTKSFGIGKHANTAVDDLSIGVARDTIFALLGPNGGGKSTTLNVIRGDVIPEEGDVYINDVSIVHHPRLARLSLGVCPQFTAIDSQLTVREHLEIYGRLKGLPRGNELRRNIEVLLRATELEEYADRLASQLSGGNQRKLSLAISLTGNPSVVLIDEFSTGIDAKTKRDMWTTLRKVAVGKAIIITTHSMEEASALADRVGILAKRLLAVGTTSSLAARYAGYEVHLPCRTREDVLRAQQLMAHVPGARQADDVATRFEVPRAGLSLAQLFHVLATQGDFAQYTVEKATLESVFLKVIREHNVAEEDRRGRTARRWWRLC
ncbi:P-loop containing nucleoside triphosphate hydrolase protein [Auriscalpium vulgare]|uniref:P-loop containing nucleoside triphosphate hydrolase protein n=1 Tax=Auriscalpium vulgare TaxID=40419 RepID=A0ACB8REZ7_9AGAM|nr:P-loop containing nucleoside triphosphate hydrolase protein [Auriscalpium vulgare]